MGACGSSPKSVRDFAVQTRIVTPRPSPVLLTAATPIFHESLSSTPFTKASFARENQLELLYGYENVLSTRLEESLSVFRDKIQGLANQIAEAMDKCHFPSEYGLTHDESAAIYLYTMRRDPNNVFYHLIRALESNDRSKCELWFKYLHLLRTAVIKLPKAKNDIYQGIQFDENMKNFQLKSMKFYSRFGSASPSIDVVRRSFERGNDNDEDSQMIQVTFEKVDAYKIFEYSENEYEEFLIWPGQKVNSVKTDSPNGILTIHLVGEPGKRIFFSSIKFSSRSIRFFFLLRNSN